jgi:hypothetical protein
MSCDSWRIRRRTAAGGALPTQAQRRTQGRRRGMVGSVPPSSMRSMSSPVREARIASSATVRPRAVRMSYRALPNARASRIAIRSGSSAASWGAPGGCGSRSSHTCLSQVSVAGPRWSRSQFFRARTARSICRCSCCLVLRNTVSRTILPSEVHPGRNIPKPQPELPCGSFQVV